MSEIIINNVRLSFPSLFEPSAFTEGDTQKYRANFILDEVQHKKEIAQIQKIQEELSSRWGDKQPRKLHNCLQHFDDLATQRPEYEGSYVLKANNKRRPVVIDADRSPLVEEDGKLTRGGDYVNAKVRFYAWDNNKSFWGQLCSLEVVQYAKEGEPLGGGNSDPMAGFDDVSNETAQDVAEEAEEFLA
jgi:hypothetical protein